MCEAGYGHLVFRFTSFQNVLGRLMGEIGKIKFGDIDSVIFGQPAAEAVVGEIMRLGAERVFLMVSATLNRETEEVIKLQKAIGDKLVGVFDKIGAHTPRQDVVFAAEEVRRLKADLIVTFGGGSVTDGAKAVGLCIGNGVQKPEDMDIFRSRLDDNGTLLAPNFAGPGIRQVSVPTTLSAGEFSDKVGVTDERSNTKEIFTHPNIISRSVILDPKPTLHTPEWLFLSTGVRAVDHCVEGICSNESNVYGDALALHGLSLLSEGLTRVKSEPSNLSARLDCQMGAWLSMGPLAHGVPMGASHGIGYILGAGFDIPHGHTSCIMLPAVMRWNNSFNADRQAKAAGAIGQIKGAASGTAADLLDALITQLEMPRRLSAVGIGPEHFISISKQALNTPWVPRNPRPIKSADQVIEILKLAA